MGKREKVSIDIEDNSIYTEILKDVLVSNKFESTPDETTLQKDTYFDKYQTAQQQERDEKITKLLSAYENNYESKVKWNTGYRLAFVIVSLSLTVLLFLIVGYCVIYSISRGIYNISLIVGSFVSLIGLPIGILKIIAEYIFPKEEEQYITQIVQSIQNNDLENKKTNIDLDKNYNKEQ